MAAPTLPLLDSSKNEKLQNFLEQMSNDHKERDAKYAGSKYFKSVDEVNFKIERISPAIKACAHLNKTLKSWLHVAKKLCETCTSSIVSDSFEKIETISSFLTYYGTDIGKNFSFKDIFICRDEALKLQSIALTDTENYELLKKKLNCISILLIATNPDNIKITDKERGIQNKDDKEDEKTIPVRGASTAIIAQIAQKCLKEKFDGVYLVATKSARPFYEKLGFESIYDDDELLLTSEKIDKLLKTDTSRFGKMLRLSQQFSLEKKVTTNTI